MSKSIELYYKKANIDGLQSIPEPYRTIVAINTAQAIIENGGFEYLFENFIAGREQDLNIIAESYKRLGFDREFAILDKLVQMYFRKKSILFSQYKEEEKIFFDDSKNIYRKIDKLEKKIGRVFD